jgi:hypothetical protein
MRFDEIDGEEFEEPGEVVAAARALKRSGTMGWGDELQGTLESTFPRLQLSPGDFFDPRVATPAAPSYTQARDTARRVDTATAEAHPGLSTAVELGTAVLHPVNKLGGAGLAGAVRGGAAQGAAQGLGDSRAELTDGDVLQYVEAFGDTAKGAGMGGAFGAAGHGVGAGLRWLGRKGGEMLDGAREQLFREEAEAGVREAAERDAPLIAIREKEAAQRAKASARLEREHGQALEMNKGADRRAARQPRGAPALSEEPGTRTLAGYQGSAGERRAVNFDRVQSYRERLLDPDLPTAERQRLERYVEKYGDAVDNPGGFERARIDQELRKRYPRDVVDRIMRERVGPDGQIRSRTLGPEEKTLPAGYEDVVAQGRAEDVARQGGGGSAWADYQPKTELVPREMADDPTRLALIRTSPEGGMDGLPYHTFEFKPRDSDEVFEVLAAEPEPGVVYVESVMPKRASGVQELHGEVANTLGPAAMRDMSRELARAFPGAKRITGQRMTGANVGHEVSLRAPEVTQAGAPGFEATQAGRPNFDDYEVPTGSPMWRENIAREVEREGAQPPHWMSGRAEGERPLTPYENAQIESQNPRTSQWEDTDVVYGYPPKEAGRYTSPLPEADDFQIDADGPVQRSPVLQAPPVRRPGAEGLQGFGMRPQPPAAPAAAPPREPTARARPRVLAEPATQPMDLGDAFKQGRAEELRRAGGGGSAFEARAAPPAAPRYGDEDVATVYEYLQGLEAIPSPAMQRAGAREADALGQVARAGYEGVKDSGNMLGAVAGGVAGITRESIRNPAVRARALSMLRVRRLGEVDPAVFARVGRALESALKQGPDEYAATVHVYNQTDPAFREATRKAEEDMEELDDAALEEELRSAGLL